MLKKLFLYTLIYVVISFLMSYNEIQCALNGEDLCWYNLLGKYLIFLLLLYIYDRLIKPRIFRKNEGKD